MQAPKYISDNSTVHTGCIMTQPPLSYDANFRDVLYFLCCYVLSAINGFLWFWGKMLSSFILRSRFHNRKKSLLFALLLVLITDQMEQEEAIISGKRMWWVHPMNAVHGVDRQGEFHVQIQEMSNFPQHWYCYFRMTVEQFDFLLAKIRHKLYRQNTNWWRSIAPEEHLTVCLR